MHSIKPNKPLGGKAYGSIGHLPQSRLGPGDWSVHEGQARICLEKPRKGDRIIVTEKLDGSCMAVANIDGRIVALSRAGYLASDALYEHLLEFVPYVEKRSKFFSLLLRPGERICGEWLALAHGTKYDSCSENFSPFVAFDIIRDGKRILTDEFNFRVNGIACADIGRAAIVHDGASPCSIEMALLIIGEHGFHGSMEPVEGAVWRVEREGRVDFLAKYVRQDKVDGKYLPNVTNNITGGVLVWNWRESA